MYSNLKICCVNVRGITDEINGKDVFNWSKDKTYSIYSLQDNHVRDKNEITFKKRLAGWSSRPHPISGPQQKIYL